MDNPHFPTVYQLMSMADAQVFDDFGWMLEPPQEHAVGLLRAVYAEKKFRLHHASHGLFQFASWLPVRRMLAHSQAPITYRSNFLAKQLGLTNLFITFSGYWPEKGAFMRSCSFKETEAFSVCARMENQQFEKVLVVASAGNTARAFAQVCSENNIPLLLCVPYDNIDALWFENELNACVRLVSTVPGSDYFDAIHLSNIIGEFEGFYAEGGAKNVARRDGMGTTVLSATSFIGRIPDYYFQAIGSGTGAIAAWEANLRFIDDGCFGSHKMKLMLSQNTPFLPIFDAWNMRSREILPCDNNLARQQASIIDAKVLSNRKPPYSIAGGLFDALIDTQGEVFAVSNEEAAVASALFTQLEGIDIHPAAAVATASLIHKVAEGTIEKDAVVMLNITGGGEQKFKSGRNLFYLKPSAVFQTNAQKEEVLQGLNGLF